MSLYYNNSNKTEMNAIIENCAETQIAITSGWDTSSKESGYLHNHTQDIKDNLDNKKISELTVKELKQIITDIVRKELIMNTNDITIPAIDRKGYFVPEEVYPKPFPDITCNIPNKES